MLTRAFSGYTFNSLKNPITVYEHIYNSNLVKQVDLLLHPAGDRAVLPDVLPFKSVMAGSVAANTIDFAPSSTVLWTL